MSSQASPVTPSEPAWSDKTLTDPHAQADKPARVRRMFAAIAHRYDLNNRVHSLWRDKAWRRRAVRAAEVQPSDRVLDVACGTGDLTQAFAAAGAARVVGLDFTQEMLDIADIKRASVTNGERIEYVNADAQALPFGDDSFDIVSIAFGIRNVQDPSLAIREFARVLKPGGRLVILEFGRPSFAPMRWLNDFYCGWVMPRTATLISRDRSGAYRYLPKSVGTFMPKRTLCGLMTASGFSDVGAQSLTGGICVCYRGVLRVSADGQ